ncbi:MAG: asparagine synthase (glutamine-hydrolyzing) [Williamsia sp.]|nr:asparagine synthase (glutamine-hydrolyzing) [Williamsia sp.]
MCGIAGIVSLQRGEAPQRQLKSMTDAISHRGPEGEGFWTNKSGQVHLGHRRLAIIDLSQAGTQPMHFNNQYSIVFNGEIYNYKEIRRDLVRKGCLFHTQTDTEVLLAAYAYYGEECLQHFDGMFAFAIWNDQEQTLFAARDRFGEKPFFYHLSKDGLFFASELKALWRAGIPKTANPKMLYNFLTLGYTLNPADGTETFFKEVYKLPAASYMRYQPSSGRLTLHSYWKLPACTSTAGGKTRLQTDTHHTTLSGTLPNKQAGQDFHAEAAVIEQFADLLQKSVARRLRSDVPVGTSLSGGLDSSSIVAVMKQVLLAAGNPAVVNTFSAVFPGYEKDESAFIRSVQEGLEIQNYQVQPTAEGMLQQFDQLCYYQDEPFGSSSIWAQFCVFELAKRHQVTVLLDGQGADEVLAGYDKYYPWYWQELFKRDRPTLRKELQAAHDMGIQKSWGWKNKLAAYFPRSASNLQTVYRKISQQRTADLQPDFVRSWGASYYTTPLPDSLENLLCYNTCCNGLEELLRYADRNSMAHGREVRLPFLSHELVEFIFSLPSHFKIRDAWTKWILRRSMEEKLPKNIVWRSRKIGFEPPQKLWMENSLLQERVRTEKEKLVQAGVLHASILLKMVKPQGALAAFNADWRYLAAGNLF